VKRHRRNPRVLVASLAVGCLLAAMTWWIAGGRAQRLPRPKPAPEGGMRLDNPGHLAGDPWSQPATCAKCHADAHAKWHPTNHALANRPIDPATDRATFPATLTAADSAERITAQWKRSGPAVRASVDGRTVGGGAVTGIIGVDPLHQLLVDVGAGRFQVTPMAWDPARREWFDVFPDDPRKPGEWGHWLSQGMNWNANCAACHMTDYRKNHDLASGGYASTWGFQGISCVQCHTGAAEHARRASAGENGTFTRLPRPVAQENCFNCHARREDLTGNFVSGDRFHDHFRLSLPDDPGLYFPDGQILDEVFETGSHHLGAMGGRGGVNCLDCHDPHSLAPILPVENDALCIRCHGSGLQNAPVIAPASHTFHKPDGAGSRCISCHMPARTYMGRDPRHDHSFPIPDPLLTRELGVPNACTNCHADKPLEWSIEAAARLWGPGMNAKRRPRARAVAAAQQGRADAGALLALLEENQPVGWRATLVSFLRQTAPTALALAKIESLATEDPDATVRARAVEVLAEWGRTDGIRDRISADPARVVRLAAASNPDAAPALPAAIRAELAHHLAFNADRPGHRMRSADLAIRESRTADARADIEAAAALLPADANALHDLAVLSSRLGDSDLAKTRLESAIALSPKQARFHHSLGLLLAERGDLPSAAAAFEAAVTHDREAGRSWYNLSVARLQLGDRAGAAAALAEARKLRGASAEELVSMEQALRR
jgi:predicted CXXCH cytochrome family protein